MPSKLLQFEVDTDEHLTKSDAEFQADLEIIANEGIIKKDSEIEDLKSSPFIQEPKRATYKPPPPNSIQNVEDKEEQQLETKPVKKIKGKKPLTEKQRLHLENMRLKRAEKQKAKLEAQMEKTDIVSKAEQKMEKPKELTDEEILNMENKEFDKWVKYMDKFNKMMIRIEEEKRKKAEIERKKELVIEERIRKKLEQEYKQRNNISSVKEKVDNVPILQQPSNEFGEYSSMFGY